MSGSLAAALNPPGRDRRPWSVGQLLSIDGTKRRASVSIDGGAAVSLPFVGATTDYTGFTTVLVIRDPAGTGAGQVVVGPLGTQAAPDVPPPPPPPTPVERTYKVTIRPTDSGTWSTKWDRFNAWNVGRYGGASTLYQSQAYGSEQLYGIAVYGNQIKALGADSITSAVLSVPAATGSGTVEVQGTPEGALAGLPNPTGATASGPLGGTISLGSTMRENLRTGASKGLVLVGTDYLAVYGTAKAAGMRLSITYTRSS